MQFNIETAGVLTRKGSTSRSAEFDQPVLIMDQTPEEGSKSWKFRLNQAALDLLHITPESEDDVTKFVTFILGDSQEEESLKGKLFLGVFGNEIQLNKNVSGGYLESRSNKNVHEALNEKFDWIDTSEERAVLSLTYVENANGLNIAEVTPLLVSGTFQESVEEERPDVDSQAQEIEESRDIF